VIASTANTVLTVKNPKFFNGQGKAVLVILNSPCFDVQLYITYKAMFI
jgi:hypothetical protein